MRKKKMTIDAIIKDGRDWLVANYQDFLRFPGKERRVLSMAYLCDTMQFTSDSKRKLIKIAQELTGVGDIDASILALASDIAIAPRPQDQEGYNPSLVSEWRRWANDRGKIVFQPSRGVIAFTGDNHIGVYVRSEDDSIFSIEWDEADPNDEEDGFYRRTRTGDYWNAGFGDI
jgi:hypothetical protein